MNKSEKIASQNHKGGRSMSLGCDKTLQVFKELMFKLFLEEKITFLTQGKKFVSFSQIMMTK